MRLESARIQLSVACLVFFFRLEHAGGGARNQATGNQPFAVRAQIIPEPGDDVAFSGGESPQPGSRDLLRGLRSMNKFLLPRLDPIRVSCRRKVRKRGCRKAS